MYAFLTPPPLPGVFIGLVKRPGTVCARVIAITKYSLDGILAVPEGPLVL